MLSVHERNISCGSRSHMLDARSIYLYISYVGTRRNKSTPVSDEGGSMFHAELIVSKEEGSCFVTNSWQQHGSTYTTYTIHMSESSHAQAINT